MGRILLGFWNDVAAVATAEKRAVEMQGQKRQSEREWHLFQVLDQRVWSTKSTLALVDRKAPSDVQTNLSYETYWDVR